MVEINRLDDPVADLMQRKQLVTRWRLRLDRLKKRKRNPKSIPKFCDDHKIRLDWLSRAMKCKPLPLHRMINKVEKALKDEGV